MKNLPNLYPLRLFLSVVVVIYHLPLICKGLNIPSFNDTAIFTKGTLAVYYFFTLSGFLILRLIFLELQKSGQFDFKKFYIRRISRLYPVYYLVFIVALILYHFLLPSLGISFSIDYSITELVLNYVFLIPNVFKYHHPDVGSIFIVLWSIGVEEQFYLIIPLFLFFFKKRIVLAVASLLSFLLLILLFFPSFYKYDNLYFYFIFGGLLAILGVKRKFNLFKNPYFHYLVYTLFLLSFFTNLFKFENEFLYAVFNMSVSGALIAIITDYPIFIMESKKIDYLGKISYGIYMYHMIVITFALFIVNKFKLFVYFNEILFIVLLNFIVIVVTLIVAHLSFKYFESLFYKNKAA